PGKGAILKAVEIVSRILEGGDIHDQIPALEPTHTNAKPITKDEVIGAILSTKKKYSTMLVLGDLEADHTNWRNRYTHHVGPINSVVNCQNSCSEDGWMVLQGYSDSILHFVAQVGSQSLVKQIEAVDRQLNLTCKSTGRHPTTLVSNTSQTTIELPAFFTTGGRAAAVQVFVSSTFRDMFGERDLISGLVFPALRKQLSHLDYPVILNEIDLRWGVPETYSQSSECIRVCLEKVVTSDYLILLLGERYGWTPPKEMVQTLPPKLLDQVMKIYVEGMSVTEMEVRLFYHLNYNKRKNLLCFIRDSSCLEGVSRDLRANFVESSRCKQGRLKEFKAFLKENGLIQLNAYPATFAGIVSSTPMMGDLSVLSEAIFKSLYLLISDNVRSNPPVQPELQNHKICHYGSSIPTAYLEAIAASVSPRHLQEVLRALIIDLPLRGAQVQRARKAAVNNHPNAPFTQLLIPTGSKRKYESHVSRDGGLLCLIGSHGSGKTTLISAVAVALSDPEWLPTLPLSSSTMTQIPEVFRRRSRVFVHLTLGAYTSTTRHSGLLLAAIPQMTQLKQLLDVWIVRMFTELRTPIGGNNVDVDRQLNALEDELKSSGIIDVAHDGDLVKSIEIFHKLLRIIGEYVLNHYIFIVDSVDHLVPNNLDWIPEIIPENVKFVFSLNGDSKTARTLSIRPDALYLRMSELSLTEKSAAIRSYFAQYGKVLNESGFANQLSKLARKRDSGLPLYLKMACDELRLYSTFENLDLNLKSLPDHLPGLVAHIVARASICCGENLVKTILACLLCSRRPPYPAQLQRMVNTWLATSQQHCPPQLAAFINGDEDRIFKNSLDSYPVLTTLALHVLLSQLQPLISGFESVDESNCGCVTSSVTEQGEEVEPSLYASKGLRLCSSEVANVVRRLCFSTVRPINRFSAHHRLGYMKSSAKTESEPISLSSTPSELQTYRLLLYEHYDDLRDKVYYAFHARKFGFVVSTLSNPVYIQQKALNNDVQALVEEFLGFRTTDPDTEAAWSDIIENCQDTNFLVIRQFVLQSGHLLSKFPHLTGQLLLDSLPGGYKMLINEEVKRTILSNNDWTAMRTNPLSAHYLRSMELAWQPEAVTLPTALASDGDLLVACGDNSGSITLLDISSGKVVNTLYGHTGAVRDIVFILPDTNELTTKCLLLYSVSADATACLWKLIPSSDDLNSLTGLKLARISGQHDRPITACAWDSRRRNLITSGLDGLVRLYTIQPSLGGDLDGGADTASGFDLSTFKKACRTFSTHYQPINAMVLVEDKIVVGCFNGALWCFKTSSCSGKVDKMLLLGSDSVTLCKGVRDETYYEEWADVSGRHAAITALAYSGPDHGLIASVDFAGEVYLINANSFECIVRLEKASRGFPRQIFSRLCFLEEPASRECLLAQTGCSKTVSGAIAIWDIDRAQICDILVQKESESPEVCVGTKLTDNILTFGTSTGGISYLIPEFGPNLVQICPPPKRNSARVQAIDCFFSGVINGCALIVYGTARGDVTFAAVSTEGDSKIKLQLGHLLGEEKRPFSVWSHSIGRQEAGGGEAGGTLAVTISAMCGFAVSGGGDADCCFHFFDWSNLCDTGCTSLSIDSDFRLSVHSAGVSALASYDNIVVSGGKDGLLAIYRVEKSDEYNPARTLVTWPQAHLDWITCLAVRQADPTRLLVASGGNDHAIGVWLLLHGQEPERSCLSPVWNRSVHMKPVTNIAFKDEYIASASSDGVVMVWEASMRSVKRLRKFALQEVSEGCELVMLEFGETEESGKNEVVMTESGDSDCNQESDEASSSSDRNDDEVMEEYESSEEEGEEIGNTQETSTLEQNSNEKSWKESRHVLFDENTLADRWNMRLFVGYAHHNGRFGVSKIAPFVPRSELACAGHANTRVSGVIELASVAKNGTLVSASASPDSLSGEVYLWRLDKKLDRPAQPRGVHSGPITVIKECKGYVFVASDDGRLSVWEVKAGRQLGVMDRFTPCSIADLEVMVRSEEGEAFRASGFVLSSRCVYLVEMGSTPGADRLTFSSQMFALQTEVFSILVPEFRPDPAMVNCIIGTGERRCLCGALPVIQCLPKPLTASSGTVTSLYKFKISAGDEKEAQYIGLCDGVIATFDSFGTWCTTVGGVDENVMYTGLQVVQSPRSLKHLLFISGKRENTEDGREVVSSFISLRSDPTTTLSEYTLPNGEIVTAFCATEAGKRSADDAEFLVIVAGSDGLIRYLKWTILNPNGKPELVGYLPTGRRIAKICAVECNHYTVGFSNGDVGIYRFIN
uniref:WD_REPEATS_REGION domain-containing protein n=1 Tax=Mesocestoides corti TaxID=53468 RepID=A0A5K3FKL3_MESCO